MGKVATKAMRIAKGTALTMVVAVMLVAGVASGAFAHQAACTGKGLVTSESSYAYADEDQDGFVCVYTFKYKTRVTDDHGVLATNNPSRQLWRAGREARPSLCPSTSEVPRTPLPRTPVNKGAKKGREPLRSRPFQPSTP